MEKNRFGKMTLIKDEGSKDYEKQRNDKNKTNVKKEDKNLKEKQGYGIFVY